MRRCRSRHPRVLSPARPGRGSLRHPFATGRDPQVAARWRRGPTALRRARGPSRRHPREPAIDDAMSFQDLREFVALLEKRGQLRRIKAPVQARARDHGDRRPRREGAGGPEPRAPLRAGRGVRHAGPDQHVRDRGADGVGARRRAAGRARREGQGAPPAQDAGLAPREAPEGHGAPRRRPRGAEGRQERPVPGGRRDRQPVDRRRCRSSGAGRRTRGTTSPSRS